MFGDKTQSHDKQAKARLANIRRIEAEQRERDRLDRKKKEYELAERRKEVQRRKVEAQTKDVEQRAKLAAAKARLVEEKNRKNSANAKRVKSMFGVRTGSSKPRGRKSNGWL